MIVDHRCSDLERPSCQHSSLTTDVQLHPPDLLTFLATAWAYRGTTPWDGVGYSAEVDNLVECGNLREAATGFPGGEPASSVALDRRREVDPDYVVVEPDGVKIKAQPTTGRKEVWKYTAVEGQWLQVGPLLLETGVPSGVRRLLVPDDGASRIRAWFEGLVV